MSERADLLVIENGERVAGTFSETEMARRLGSLRSLLEVAGLDAAVFSSMHNIHYYSDFLYCSFGRPFGLVVTEDRATVVAANVDYGQPRRRAGDTLTYTDWRQDSYFRAIRQLAEGRRRVGVEFDHLTVERFDRIKAALPHAELLDISAETMRQRMVKSAEEIVLIESAAQIADIGGRACIDAIAPGVGEHEVALAGNRCHGARDRTPPSRDRNPGYLGLAAVRNQHGRRPQSGYHAKDRLRRHHDDELLPHDRGLLCGT